MYEPQENDYVTWKNNIQGWVYFKGKQYITIEVNVRPKTDENYAACDLHRNDRLLVLCYQEQWYELEYLGYRINKHSKEILSTK